MDARKDIVINLIKPVTEEVLVNVGCGYIEFYPALEPATLLQPGERIPMEVTIDIRRATVMEIRNPKDRTSTFYAVSPDLDRLTAALVRGKHYGLIEEIKDLEIAGNKQRAELHHLNHQLQELNNRGFWSQIKHAFIILWRKL